MSTDLRQMNPATSPAPASLPILPGPWQSDVWLIERPLQLVASGTSECVVAGCNRPAGTAEGDKPRPTDVLCVGHRRRLRKQGGGMSAVDAFVAEQSGARPIRAPGGAVTRKPFFPPVDFTLADPQLALELRYITGIRITRGHWTCGEYVVNVLRETLAYGREHQLRSLLDFPVDVLALEPSKGDPNAGLFRGRGKPFRDFRTALRKMIRILTLATTDPWDAEVWHHADLGIPNSQAAGLSLIYWRPVTCSWLLQGMKRLARQHLQAGTRTWTTVRRYIQGAGLMSRFMAEEAGPIEPAALTRRVFLDFVHWVRFENPGNADLIGVNSLARNLVELRAEGITPDLPDTTFLLRGENIVRKVRQPKPFPADVLQRLDEMIANDLMLPAEMRLMLRLFRATGPRASEALLLPRDCIRHVEGRGYSLEYFQTKTQDWRRVPLPDRLGRDLAAHAAAVVEHYGEACPWMFPYAGPTPRTNTLLPGATESTHWPYARFSAAVWSAYRRNGITSSALTGEILTGPNLHRFRHSIATGLLNEGWSQYEVQKFLGHKSAVMMQSYAEIHEDTLRTKYIEFVNHAIDVNGQRTPAAAAGAAQVERLRDKMIRSTLPNGYCTLPEKQNCDFVPTPCLSCKPFFRTTPTFLPIHIRQRDEALRELDLAKDQGRHRAAEAHEKTLSRLEVIIASLESEKETIRAEEAS
ncbi:site-specific integrase [Actinoplanes sp. NPDC049802]|uniref:tyrosine-type recombinase/integrase n=1 Tax=Actinoplanes sp. NPDC049802 TaxID=3154742 RepID=UPI0033E076F8